MSRVLIVADDLTGANACAAGFARAGLRALTTGFAGGVSTPLAGGHAPDVVVATTESRHSDPVVATSAVTAAVDAGWPADLVCARIDTTLRGNVGVAAEALLAAVRERAGRRAVGLCIPAFPAAGRQTIDGQQLLDGQRLETTELARDVRSPVTTSSVADVLRRGTDLRVAHVPMHTVAGSASECEAALRALLADDAIDVIVGDALADHHIWALADAAVTAARELDVVLCGIDPGPGSLAIADAMGLTTRSGSAPMLAVSGSSTHLTMRQLDRLAAQPGVAVLPAVLDGRLPALEANADAIAAALADPSHATVLWATVREPGDICDLSAGEAAEMPRRIGAIARAALDRHPAAGLYTTGGDITSNTLVSLGATGIDVAGEAMPLAVIGTLVGGAWDGLPIVTKGGLIGDDDAALACLAHLDDLVRQRRRWTHTI